MRSPGVLVPDTQLIRDLNVGAGRGDNADTGETGTQRHGEVTPAQTLAICTLPVCQFIHTVCMTMTKQYAYLFPSSQFYTVFTNRMQTGQK